jgi:hypothetical protein
MLSMGLSIIYLSCRYLLARTDVTDLGDDVRVRDKASLDASKAAAREAEDRGGGPKRRGEAGVSRADAGARLLAAAVGRGEGGDGGDGGAVALLRAVRDLIREEGGVARLVRPHLVKALGAVGHANGGSRGDDDHLYHYDRHSSWRSPPVAGSWQTVSLGDDGDRRVSSLTQMQEIKELVAAAVEGAALCMLALDIVEDGGGGTSNSPSILQSDLLQSEDKEEESIALPPQPPAKGNFFAQVAKEVASALPAAMGKPAAAAASSGADGASGSGGGGGGGGGVMTHLGATAGDQLAAVVRAKTLLSKSLGKSRRVKLAGELKVTVLSARFSDPAAAVSAGGGLQLR